MLSLMDHDLRQACEGTATTIGLEVEVKEFWYFPPTLSISISSPRCATPRRPDRLPARTTVGVTHLARGGIVEV